MMGRLQLTKLKFWLQVILGIGLATGLAIALHEVHLPMLWQRTILWINHLGATGVIAFIVIYNLATILFIPGFLLTVGGGALYGVFWGSLYVVIASTLGATVAFLIGRHFTRGWVCQQLQEHPKFQAIDAAVAKEGFKIVLLTRLSPIFPFNLLNYVFGMTCVSSRAYILGSIGMIPGSVLYVYIGSLAGDVAALGMPQAMSPQAQMAQWFVKIIGFLATVAVTLYITRIAKTALSQTVASRD